MRPIDYLALLDRPTVSGKVTSVVGVVFLDPDTESRSAVRFIDDDGDTYGIKQIDGKIRTSSMPYLYDIAEGNVPGHEIVRASGHNETVGTSWETVYDADILKPWLTVAERLQITSTSAADDGAPAGNGARTVTISGLTAALAPMTETVTMNGIANVLTDASFFRVVRMDVATAGVTGYNEGAITASNNADTDVLAQMDAMENRSHGAYYTVPAGHTLYIVNIVASEASTKGSKFAIFAREPGGLWVMIEALGVSLDSPLPYPTEAPLIFPAGTDVEIRCRAILAGAIVAASFYGWQETG